MRPDTPPVDRRGFLSAVAAAAVVGPAARSVAAPSPKSKAETAVAALYDTLTGKQKNEICFDWDHRDPKRGLLRTHVSNFWHVTEPTLTSDFYTKDQRAILRDIFTGMFDTEWHDRLTKQLADDHDGPWGSGLTCAIFGKPGTDACEFVLTGRHMTVRADGNSAAHVALGGPIFHGHAPSGYTEKVHHPGNVFWHQAELANKVYTLLGGKQQAAALVEKVPAKEYAVPFRGGKGKVDGLPCADLTRDQRAALEQVLLALIEPYRADDRDEVKACLKARGGLEKCSLAFFREGDTGDDGEWDNWRLEGPAFVWYYRGSPHVHIWVNVADDPNVPLNARNF